MSKAAKIAAIVLGSMAVMLLGTGVLLAWTVATQGVVRIAVDDRESGTRIDLPLPAALVGAGLGFVPALHHHHGLACRHHAEWKAVQPALAAFFESLEEAPDAVLVEVQDGEEWVRIRKSGRDLEILVESPDADVHLSMPAHLLHRIVRAAA